MTAHLDTDTHTGGTGRGGAPSNRQQAIEEAAVSLECDAKVLGGGISTTRPLLLQVRPLLREDLGQSLDRGSHQRIGALHRLAWFIHEPRLDVGPAMAEVLGLAAGEER